MQISIMQYVLFIHAFRIQKQESFSDINSVTVELIQHLTVSPARYRSPVFHGVLGPGRMGDAISKRLTPIFQNTNWLQVGGICRKKV